MLLLMFFLPALVSCNNCSRLQHKTPRKRPIYTIDLNAETQDIQHYDVLITDMSIGILNKFWKSTGLCPPDPHQESFKFFLSKDMKQNLFHIGSLPFDGITQVRIHWLLDLVHMSVKTSSDVTYDFTFLDDLIHELWKNNLHLGFELMGNPSNFFTDFENRTQVYMWRDLVATTANRYINFYDIEYVMKWNFESWNEPDHHDFDKLNFTVQGFLNYYDACSEGLKLTDKRLKFGGPGGSCRIPTEGHSPLCWALLQHCFGGKNFFTGKIGSRMDFISFHKKGNASSLLIVEQERQTIEYMRRKFKIPNNIPFYNDEADPLKNWALPQFWRADATYAAMAVKILLSHIDEYYMKNETRDIRFGLLSNDNAFLSYFPYQFTERTLLARFQVNNTQPKYVEFVKKPIYAIFGLLSQLCPSIIPTKVYKQGKRVRSIGDFGIVATHCADRNQIVLVMYNSADSILSNVTYDIDLYLNLTSFSAKKARWIAADINNVEANSYLIWQKLGEPFYPTTEEFSFMKDNEGPQINGPWSITSSPYKLHLKILNPGITMVNICKTRFPLEKVNNIRFLLIKNNTIQISWTDTHNRCVLTYNVEYSAYAHGPYAQLNQKLIVYPTYWHSCRENDVLCSVKGFYRVYAVDYWNIHGPFSIVAEFKEFLN